MTRLPLPPLELRRIAGPIDDRSFDNPKGKLIFPDLPLEAYDSVFDWGCGCGRTARQLMLQKTPPKKYVGVDLNRTAVQWCVQHLAPHASQFEFLHQDVYNIGLNPKGTANELPFPVEDQSVSLLIAWSVFSNVLEQSIPFYLREVARVLRPDGIAYTTWLVFDKNDFPVLLDSQNAMYINPVDPTNAVYYDRSWLQKTARQAGLIFSTIHAPGLRGGARRILMRPASSNAPEADFTDAPPWWQSVIARVARAWRGPAAHTAPAAPAARGTRTRHA